MIFEYKPDTEFNTPERCYITELYSQDKDNDIRVWSCNVHSQINNPELNPNEDTIRQRHSGNSKVDYIDNDRTR